MTPHLTMETNAHTRKNKQVKNDQSLFLSDTVADGYLFDFRCMLNFWKYNNEYYLKIFWSASLRWLIYVSFECLWVSFICVSFVVAATNLPRYFLYVAVTWYSGMETPKFGFIEKHAGIIQDWWMERIKYLCNGDEQESAKALFKEFHLGDDLSFPQRF